MARVVEPWATGCITGGAYEMGRGLLAGLERCRRFQHRLVSWWDHITEAQYER